MNLRKGQKLNEIEKLEGYNELEGPLVFRLCGRFAIMLCLLEMLIRL